MTGRGPRIVVTVAPDGQVSAVTEGLYGDRCLDYIAVLEELIEARTVRSAYTADHARTGERVAVEQEEHDVDRA